MELLILILVLVGPPIIGGFCGRYVESAVAAYVAAIIPGLIILCFGLFPDKATRTDPNGALTSGLAFLLGVFMIFAGALFCLAGRGSRKRALED